jgi:large subunit ribosomal protein L24
MATQRKMHIRTGDIVHVIAGKERGNLEDKAKRGKVLRVIPEQGRVVVERMNFVKRHTRPNRTNRQGGILEREGKIHVSNVMVVCPKCDKPSRLKSVSLEDGSKSRACVRCDELLDK